MHSIYLPQKVTIQKIIQETPTIKTFVFKPEGKFSFKTGQFVELTSPGIGEAPFTPSSNPFVKDEFEVTIMEVGRVTKLFHQAKEADCLGLRGPYGRGYPLEDFVGKDILIVGGGVGLAPLRSLIFALIEELDKYNKILIRYGARTPKDIVYKDYLKEWEKIKKIDLQVTVDMADPSWHGNVGLVTTILKDLPLNINNAVSVVCGPPIMMKFTTLKLLDLGFKPSNIYLSMEKNMSCGLGKCGHCRLGRFYVCQDGPVFKFEEIKDIQDIWD
ncbi:MAG: FAD/NAD(P)-binding protein [Candidatus Omnitrophica bacterium]|nr:FAD/NAD(P)-binding protein [Candidatus Omnitrophota bacterium]